MRYLYTCLLYLLTPFILIRLIWKARHNHSTLSKINERFGYITLPKKSGGIWIHAVSVGETIATVPLIKQLQKEYPDTPIFLSTTTATGRERAKALFGGTLQNIYMPYDYPGAIQRTLQRLQPKLLILIETEIWPNLLHQCKKIGIPVMLANARLSEKSARLYSKVPSLTREMLQNISVICSQNQADASRFIDLGARPDTLIVTGSVKFDQQIPPSTHEKAASFRHLWGNRPVWVAASTHEGEEELVLQTFNIILKSIPDLLLVLVPRHPERFSKVANLCRKQGYSTQLRSENQACSADTKVMIGDSMGELAAFYAASDVAYVGGSLIPIGGHNLLEPAALGIPAVTGHYVFNFAEITTLLVEAGGVKMVTNITELADVVIHWLLNPTARSCAGEQARKVVEKNRGAVHAHLEQINACYGV